ncbi:hypothetical protein [Streptacidiphilus sp. EB103A]|uniref:hypothetical protein n=1 Tax=Streptacidiphilus sp. EB103A TaxID=3156275 RepID=UPI0035116B08
MRQQRAHLSAGVQWSDRLRSRSKGSPAVPPPDPLALAAERRELQNTLVLLQRAVQAGDAAGAVELYRAALEQARTSTSASQLRWLASLEEDGRLARWTDDEAADTGAVPAPTAVADGEVVPAPRRAPGPPAQPLRRPAGQPSTAITAPEPAPVPDRPATDPARLTAAAVQVRAVLAAAAAAGTTVTWSALLRRAPALGPLTAPEREQALTQASTPRQPDEPLLAAVVTGPLRDMHPRYPHLARQTAGPQATADPAGWAYEVLRVQQYWRHRHP